MLFFMYAVSLDLPFNIDIGQTTLHFSWSIRLNLVEVTCLPQKAISLQFVFKASFKGPFPRHISNDQSSLIRHKAYQSCKSIENHKVPSMNSVPGQKWKETWKQFGRLQLLAQHLREDEKTKTQKIYPNMNAMMRNCRLRDDAPPVPPPPPPPPVRKAHWSPRRNEASRASVVIAKIHAMKKRESTTYAYRNYIEEPCKVRDFHRYSDQVEEVYVWREKICHWTYSVIDHFGLSRKTAAISIDIFDRYLATQGNFCDGSFALLASLTTLYIAIKVHETKKIKLSTLSELSGGQFVPKDIEEMEMEMLQSLHWFVHPPIVVDFTSLLLKFLPPTVPMPIRHQIFEHSRYLGELSLCDPVFIHYHKSTIAFAAIINVLEHDMSNESVPLHSRQRFFRCLQEDLGFHRGKDSVRFVCERLHRIMHATGVIYHHRDHNKENDAASTSSSSGYRPPTSSRPSLPRPPTKEIDCGYSQSDDLSVNTTYSFDSGSASVDAKRIMTPDARSTCSIDDCSMGSRGSKGLTASRLLRAATRKGMLVAPSC